MISVIIPNYNCSDLLKKYFKDNYHILKNELKDNFEIIISDDQSEDDSISYIKELKLPEIKIIINTGKRGFGENCNNGARIASGEYLFFLNTDVKLTEGFIEPLLDKLKDKKVFSVAPRIMQPLVNNRVESITLIKLTWWNIKYDHLNTIKEKDINKDHKILWASGSAFICKRNIFYELGGFSPEYSPYYLEDTDLGMKSCRMSHENWYINKSEVFHYHNSTIWRLEKKSDINKISCRNGYIFLFKHFWKDKKIYIIWIVFLRIILLCLGEMKLIISAVYLLNRSKKLKYILSGGEVIEEI